MSFIETLAESIENNQTKVNNYISNRLKNSTVPVYSSFDIRNGGFKIAVVDPNVFPAGFNNICQESLRTAAPVLEQIIRKRFSEEIQVIGIYTEDHTKNKYYLQNLYSLLELFQDTGFESILVTTNDDLDEDPAQLETAMRDEVELHRIKKDGDDLLANQRKLDLIISNNDFSTGVPEVLKKTNIPITPPPEMGWWNRKKIDHFNHNHELCRGIADILDIDPWRLIPETRSIDDVDFSDKTKFDSIARAIDEVTSKTEQKYNEHGISETPSAFVKSNSGTYGMGVYRFESGDEFLQINRDQRDSMDRRKGGGKNDSVIVQEAIRTVDRVAELVAEPVIYCLEHRPIGGFLRTNEEQTDRENLNTRGMNFTSEDLCTLFVDDADKNEGSNITQDKIEAYKLLSTIGTLACGQEISQLS